MSWPFLAVVFSGWIYIQSIYRGPVWQRSIFKPITLALLLLWVWQAPNHSLSGYLIFAGLLLSLLGDVLAVLLVKRPLSVLGAYFAGYLLYSISFATQLSFSQTWSLPIVLIALSGAVVAFIWPKLAQMKWPVLIYYCVTALMVFLAGERYVSLKDGVSLSISVGALFLWASASFQLISRYRIALKAADGIVASLYFFGHFMIAYSLHLVSKTEAIVTVA